MREYDFTEGPRWLETDMPLSRDKFVLGYDPDGLKVCLAKWKNRGIRITVYVDGKGGVYGDKPFEDRETAENEYARVVQNVEAGNYRVELQQDGSLKLVLTGSE